MLETVWETLLHLVRGLLGALLRERVLFQLGRGTLWLLSFGRWRARRQGNHSDWISAAGLLPLLALWLALAAWNNRHG